MFDGDHALAALLRIHVISFCFRVLHDETFVLSRPNLLYNGAEADPPSAGLAEWLGISIGLEKGERLFPKFVTEK